MPETACCATVPRGDRGPEPIGGALRLRLRACALVFALTTALVVTLTAGPAYAKQPDPNGRDSFEVYEDGTLRPDPVAEVGPRSQPASRLSRTAGRLVAVCTAAISAGESDSEATTVTAPTLCIQMTTCDPSREPQIARNTGRRSGAHAEPR